MRWLIIGFGVFSLIEIGLLIWIGSNTGVWPLLLFIILTALLGFAVGRKQGFKTWERASQSMQSNQVPAAEIVDGLCIIVGSLLLIAPGLISDIIGLTFLLPFSRSMCKRIVSKLLYKLVQKGPIIYLRF
ncbi:FxsA family protein [Oceanobacillus luteolus]|uniref:FxsA family protein n=1 Tax=Oceanobacillus luteolus TaxID=1274358 RepID=UPI002041AE5D|nr:FxsA family protein [Oceanobacillus luteolus]MCM3741154.1 FxsA family protein [Oceanobacillus luteolus]